MILGIDDDMRKAILEGMTNYSVYEGTVTINKKDVTSLNSEILQLQEDLEKALFCNDCYFENAKVITCSICNQSNKTRLFFKNNPGLLACNDCFVGKTHCPDCGFDYETATGFLSGLALTMLNGERVCPKCSSRS
jgi:hypothetical protein